MRETEYGPVADGISTHSTHMVHYWVGQKDGKGMNCGCGAHKNNETGEITYG